ncbi:hypothetical protein MSTO_50300 [Mycobacterium stomatepiae]|uniref:Uncharacterized protein n=1 Tax=Mycobacterium stomatepiae TaxID=470076 RepID=A0A7I7QEP2_9MYCO|nr:hypothetical protein MSTO_50300 [Mycobacterium stomatepiae]
MSATLGGMTGVIMADSGPGSTWLPQPLNTSAAQAPTAAAPRLSVRTIVAMLEGFAPPGERRLRHSHPDQ